VKSKLVEKKIKTGKEGGEISVQQKKAPKVNYVKVTESSEVVAVNENKQPTSLVFIGHVDVGKSTICGNLMLLTGQVD
jgi:peptide chain release factor subunit 3